MKRRVLYVSHNHPSIRPGGAETYAFELYRAMQGSAAFEPMLLARTGPPFVARGPERPGTSLAAADHDPNQYFFRTEIRDFNWLTLVNRQKDVYLSRFREFLDVYKPDVVHFQHSLFFGVDALLATRQALPDAPIVYTLHEYLPICHNNGQMVRPQTGELCRGASPAQCHACFPDVSEQSFFLRRRFIASHLARVDQFLAPSRFLLERFVDWGIPRERIHYEEYGRLPMTPVPGPDERPSRNRIGFFGQLTAFKGLPVLLQAIKILAGMDRGDRPMPHVWIHGSNLEFAPKDFQSRFRRLLAATRKHVTFTGPYDPSELPQLMADVDWVVVPSIWWENSPLVIQEAFAHGRPVICSGIGGMAEKVADGVNGLHFRVGDPVSLAETIRRGIDTPGLWETLRNGVTPPHAMKEHVAHLEDVYRGLIESRSPSTKLGTGPQ